MGNAITYINMLLEAEESKTKTAADELAEKIENNIKEVFPKSFVYSRVNKQLGTSIDVRFALFDKGEWENNIIHNDPVHTMITIGYDQINDDGSLQDKLTAESHVSGITIKPEPGTYYARGKIKFPLRKKTDTHEKIANYIKQYFVKLKETIAANIDKMMDDDAKLAKTKI